ncbi:hypothetical protein CERZMDRAFT_50015 [Cercospora zeae-maydis SCOH1-5]|uniref:Protein kinase domain-containing protein n=1 Tax=Cercospora zeae-maydis SCOH1-5 TaxID=717836 RepID=A0A6A6F2T4_9PEZI|nr:hypothetical protein CERZMDRAFT_50015 [Cercospora zeae-maydis SCOH1-5]
MNSTITCDSGRTYTDSQLLRRHPEDTRVSNQLSRSANRSFVWKRVPRRHFDLAQRIAHDLPSSQHLRVHVDCNSEQCILVFDYFQDTLLSLLKHDPDLSPDERPKIMRSVSEAVYELHSQGWVHTDIKPDNVFIDWTRDDNGNKLITRTTLGDFDIACKLQDGETRITPHAVGNVMWRSPEAQACMANKATDIYSLGLVFIHALGGGELLVINDWKELIEAGIPPEQDIVTKHFCYFGPVPESLYNQIRDEDWRKAFRAAAEAADLEVTERPEMRMRFWTQGLGENTVDLLEKMTNLDPKCRPKIEEVLAHRYWQDSLT